MDRDLQILMLEDLETDAELAEHELKQAGISFRSRRVETEADFRLALDEFKPDVVLADYSLPEFDGVSALKIARRECPQVPFIFVSGAIGEKRAIETLKQGATDYVLKDGLSRLAPAVRQAVRETEEHAARLRAEKALRRSEEMHRALLELNNAIIGSLTRVSLVDALAGALQNVQPLDSVCLLLQDGSEAVRLDAVAGHPQIEGLKIGSQFSREDSLVTTVLETPQPLLHGDLHRTAHTEFGRALRDAGIRSCVTVPLLGEQGVFGILNLGNRRVNSFSNDDNEFLMEIGQQVSLAVQNMVAYEEIARLKSQFEQENRYLQEEIGTDHNFAEIIGQSEGLRNVLATIETVAPTTASVLITGETGTGKELVARAIHRLSVRKEKPLIKVNCASVPKELFESEFFGHVKGAFTGAVKNRVGRFELADGGTLFLDEVCEISLDLQSKLLRVLQEHEFERIGDERTRRVDVRMIAATNREPSEEIDAKRFRRDLFFRLNVVPISVPPLRERGDDVLLLAEHFLNRACQQFNRGPFELDKRQKNELRQYAWPGNVRELCNVIERSVVMSKGGRLELDQLLAVPSQKPSSSGEALFLTDEEFKEREKANITAALKITGWRIGGEDGAAELLGIPPSTLANRLRKLGIAKPGSATD